MRQRYLEDFKLGEVSESPAHTLTQNHFTAFAEMTGGDAHPIHYDADYARAQGSPRRSAASSPIR